MTERLLDMPDLDTGTDAAAWTDRADAADLEGRLGLHLASLETDSALARLYDRTGGAGRVQLAADATPPVRTDVPADGAPADGGPADGGPDATPPSARGRVEVVPSAQGGFDVKVDGVAMGFSATAEGAERLAEPYRVGPAKPGRDPVAPPSGEGQTGGGLHITIQPPGREGEGTGEAGSAEAAPPRNGGASGAAETPGERNFWDTAANKTLDVAVDAIKGIQEAPKQVVGGLSDAVGNALSLFDPVVEELEREFGTLPKTDISVEQPDSVTGAVIRDMSRNMAGFFVAYKLLRKTGLVPMPAVILAGAAEGVFADPLSENLANFIQSFPELQNPVTALLATDKDDPELVNRLRNAVMGIVSGGLGELAYKIIRSLVSLIRVGRAAQQPPPAAGQGGAPDALPGPKDGPSGPDGGAPSVLGDPSGPRVTLPEASPVLRLPAPKRALTGSERYGRIGNEDYVRFEDGTLEAARISPEIVKDAGLDSDVIRLPKGEVLGPHRGKGELHIIHERASQIAKIQKPDGSYYSDVAEFVSDVGHTFTEVREARSGALMLVARDPNRKSQHLLIVGVQRAADGTYEVVTAGRFKNAYVNGFKLRWQGVHNAPPRPGPTDPSPPPPFDGPGNAGAFSVRDQRTKNIGNSDLSVNFSRVETHDDFARTLQDAERLTAGSGAPAGDVRAAMAALGEALGVPAARIVRGRGISMAPAEAAAARRVWAATTETLTRAAENAVGGDPARLYEFGRMLAMQRGLRAHLLADLSARLAASADVPAVAQEAFALLLAQLADLDARIGAVEARLRQWHRASPVSQRLAAVPGIGPILATALAMKLVDPHAFRSGRDFAAWLGLTPKNHSTAGRQRLGGITRAGDKAMRALLVTGAMAVIQRAKPGRTAPWLLALLARKPKKLAAVALANKTARIVWAMMTRAEPYRRPAAA